MCKCCERGRKLQRQYPHRLSWSPRQPLNREECNDRYLCNHEQLKDMGGGPLIGHTDNAEHDNVTKQCGEGGERHCHRKKGAC